MKLKVKGSRFENKNDLNSTEDAETEPFSGPAVAVPFRWEESPGRAKKLEKDEKPVLKIQSGIQYLTKQGSLGRSSEASLYRPIHKGNIPFDWEEKPGVAKTPAREDAMLPQLSPPPILRSPASVGFSSRVSSRPPLAKRLKRLLKRTLHGEKGQEARFNMAFESSSFRYTAEDEKNPTEDEDLKEEIGREVEFLSRNVSYRSFESFESAFKFSPSSSSSTFSSCMESVVSAAPDEMTHSASRRCFPACSKVSFCAGNGCRVGPAELRQNVGENDRTAVMRGCEVGHYKFLGAQRFLMSCLPMRNRGQSISEDTTETKIEK